jgi:hypothetical protein
MIEDIIQCRNICLRHRAMVFWNSNNSLAAVDSNYYLKIRTALKAAIDAPADTDH